MELKGVTEDKSVKFSALTSLYPLSTVSQTTASHRTLAAWQENLG
jgi:hypothetical protein